MIHVIVQLAPYALLTGGIAACTSIFLSLKKELFALSNRMKEQQSEIWLLKQKVSDDLEGIRLGLREAEERTGVLVPPPAPKSGFNLNKRSQAMRMSKHGENPQNIATALSLPRKEVELLLKVQKIVLNSAGPAGHPTS